MTGASSASKAEELQLGLISNPKQAQFDLSKWTRSDPELVLSLSPEFREADENFKCLDEEHTVKTLEFVSNPSCDTLRFTVSKSHSLKAESITSCHMLSNIVQTFDPRGLLTPVINCLKDLMQKT